MISRKEATPDGLIALNLLIHLSDRLPILLTPFEANKEFWLTGVHNVVVTYRWDFNRTSDGQQSYMNIHVGFEEVKLIGVIVSNFLAPFAAVLHPLSIEITIEFLPPSRYSKNHPIRRLFELKDLQIFQWNGVSLVQLEGTTWNLAQWIFFKFVQLISSNVLVKWLVGKSVASVITRFLKNQTLQEVGIRMICQSDCK